MSAGSGGAADAGRVPASVRVSLGAQSYDVHTGRGLLEQVPALAGLPEGSTTLVVTQAAVAAHHLPPLRAALRSAGHHVVVAHVPDGEQAKTPASLAALWDAAAAVPLTRRDAVVALGGGTVGDLAGFLAATWNRGVPVVQVPTTLLAQVDAAIGGKTGINLPAGKNLVGAFHQPRVVVCDLGTLRTLPPRVRREGFGEVVKHGLLGDERILGLLESDPRAAATDDGPWLDELVARNVAVKAAVVGADEREAGERAHLNLGHTLAHAIETLTDHTWLHGEAVAAGTVAALRLGERLGHTPPSLAERGEALLRTLGLPTRLPAMDRASLWDVVARDKKADRGARFVLLEDVGRCVLVRPDRADVDAVVDALTAPTA